MSAKAQAKLTAADIMQRHMVCIGMRGTLQEALALMTDSHVTGLPVVGGKSKCVGLISASDILSYEQEHAEQSAAANAEIAQHFNPDLQQWESVRLSAFALEEFGDVYVEDVMTREVVTVPQDMPIRKVAAKMRDAGIHRVLVVDDDSELLGIISSFDFVLAAAE